MRRVFRFGFRRHIEREVDDELAFHLAMRADALRARGLPPEGARTEALRRFGDVGAVRDSCVTLDQEHQRAMARADLLTELRRDLAFALRILRRDAAFATVVALTLALGIGANTAIFTLVDAVMLRRLPVREPERLVTIGDPARTNSFSEGTPRADLISYPLYRDLRDHARSLDGILASGITHRLDARIDGATELEHPRGRFVSANYFTLLGLPAQRGRAFAAPGDDALGAAPVVVISDGWWTRRFERDPGIVGRPIVVNGTSMTVIGVAPVGWQGEIVGQATDVWLPVSMQAVLQPNQPLLDERRASWLLLLGRLRPGATLEQARAELTTLIPRELAEHAADPALGAELAKRRLWIESGARGFSRLRRTYGAPLVTLMAGGALLLLVVCANVANLLLARATTRGREMAVRLALGADRLRIVRQLLTESVVLALVSAAAGLVVAWWGSRLLLALVADGAATMPLDVRLDAPVLLYAVALSVCCVLLFGLAPALRTSRVDLASAMRAGARALSGGIGSRGGRNPLGRVMIAGQVAFSLVLLVGAGLLVHSLRNVQQADTGADREHLLVVDLDVNGRGYRGERLTTFARDLAGRIAALPGVAGVTYSGNGLFEGTDSDNGVQVPGFTPTAADDSLAHYDQIGAGFFQSIGARMVEGREISAADVSSGLPVAVVNATMARFYFGRASAVGRTLRLDDSTTVQVVGVVADVKAHDLTEAPERRFYLPYRLRDPYMPTSLFLVVRAPGDPAAVAPAVRRAIVAADPSLMIEGIDPLATLMRLTVREERLLARLATGIGALALLLAAIGLYGVMSYAVARRTAEIGLRVALGARPERVVGMVLGEALALVGVGVAVGIPLAIAASRLLGAQLHGVGAVDPWAIGASLVVLAGSALLAAWLPARRAAGVPPLVALRDD